MVANTVRTWVAGWAASPRTPPPVEKPWGFYIEVTDSPGGIEGRYAASSSEEGGLPAGAFGRDDAAACGHFCRVHRTGPGEPMMRDRQIAYVSSGLDA